MKLIIDVPDNTYANIQEHKRYTDFTILDLIKAIRHGTPIPDNATDGDMIKALFHNIKYEEGYVYVKSNTYKNVIMTVREDWWNAPYQKGGKE